MTELKIALMQRDELSSLEADELINEALEKVQIDGEDPSEVLLDMFGLGADYIYDII